MASLKPMVGGIIVPVKNVQTMYGGILTQVKSVRAMSGGVLVTVWENEIAVAVLANVNNLNVRTLFDPVVWASATPKRVVVNSGVNVGSHNSAVPAMRTGTARGGPLIIENNGSILGAGGVANSGVGGNAFLADQACSLVNAGNIYSGGGGGGPGGNGGGGSYSQYTYQSGSGYYNENHDSENNYTKFFIRWNGVHVATWGKVGSGATPQNRHAGGWYYYWPHNWSCNFSQRRSSNPVTYYTNGGIGGNGGRGHGYDAANQAGNGGANGGTNAGSGGTGGTGGGWGANGSNGLNGANGNHSGGVGGLGGGLAGFALANPNLITLDNSGIILGRT